MASAVEFLDDGVRSLRSQTSSVARNGNGYRDTGSTRGTSLAQGMGWFSIGLGLAQVLAPHKVADLIGVEDSDRNVGIMRACGMREIASGLGLFSQKNDGAFMWARVAGDAMDLALLSAAMRSPRNDRSRLVGAAVAVAGATALDMLVARQRSNPQVTEMNDDAVEQEEKRDGSRIIRKSITINASADQVSETLERFMADSDLKRLPDAQVSMVAGPRSGETEVKVEVTYEPRLGAVGAGAARLTRKDPSSQLHRELRHLEQLVEVGEIVHSDASIHRGMHPAKPSREARV
ncbi:MAG TPA: hypothetical protein VEB19_11415 [Gemmatimonadaceae bacterium]|nr:hypothetical protein [Gemmatimonadaceae bacterium]